MPLSKNRLYGTAAVTGTLVAAVVLSAQAAVAPLEKTGVFRVAGPDRYQTSVALSGKIATPPQDVVYIASGADFPDALAAGPAIARAQAPLLLVKPDSVPDSIAEELQRLEPAEVRIIGGKDAVSTAVADAIEAATEASVTRIGGADRYETAALFGGEEERTRVVVASGETFADALAGGPAAAMLDSVIVLTRKDQVPTATLESLEKLNPDQIVVLGGEAAITPETAAALGAVVPGATVNRIAGANRYETAAAVATEFWPDGSDTVFYAAGANFPDALSGVPVAALSEAPILLTHVNEHPVEVREATATLGAETQITLGGASVAYMESNSPSPSATATTTPSGSASPTATPTVPAGPDPTDVDNVRCSDFTTQAQAQKWYDYWYPTVGDKFGLDRDKDGRACEALP
ncbi:MAG: cell wall-binding repeat-containing protein [Propioniciclava sp.]